LTRLDEFTSRALSPTNAGVRHRVIASECDVGFIATVVPTSDVEAMTVLAFGNRSVEPKRAVG
jgi:hypothetical protein